MDKQEKPDWSGKGASMSDKSAREEYGISQEDILEGMKSGKLHFHQNDMWGNPYFKIIRKEVEAFIIERYGKASLERRIDDHRLKKVNGELRQLKSQMKKLEAERGVLTKKLEGK